jgi:hypothetical protein
LFFFFTKLSCSYISTKLSSSTNFQPTTTPANGNTTRHNGQSSFFLSLPQQAATTALATSFSS